MEEFQYRQASMLLLVLFALITVFELGSARVRRRCADYAVSSNRAVSSSSGGVVQPGGVVQLARRGRGDLLDERAGLDQRGHRLRQQPASTGNGVHLPAQICSVHGTPASASR